MKRSLNLFESSGRALLLALLLVPLLAVGAAAEKIGPDDPDPLRQADTSSPRATLQSFLAESEQAIQIRRAGYSSSQLGYNSLLRAFDTMDFSDTPEGDAWSTKALRMLLLREILDRIELPPWDEIPGPEAVAGGNVFEWEIAGSRVDIVRIEDGPRAGDFVFSAQTVEGLDRLYKKARSLPYQPGALGDVYEDYLADDNSMAAETARVRARLKPVDTASPRSTLSGFLHAINKAYEIVTSTEAALSADPPGMSQAEAREAEERALAYLDRAVKTLDLSAVPQALRADVGPETALILKEIIDRVPLPPIESVPVLAEAPRRGSGAGSLPPRWRLPNTSIELIQMTEGERAGGYLFDARSVRLAPEFYALVKDLPYRSVGAGLAAGWSSPEASPGFYDHYATTPGYLIPAVNPLSALVDSLPDALKAETGGQTRWQWLGMLIVIVIVAALAWLIFALAKRLAQSRSRTERYWLLLFRPVLLVPLVRIAAAFIDNDLGVTGGVLAVVVGVSEILIVALIAYAVFLFFRAVGETALVWSSRRRDPLNANLIRIGYRVLGFLAAAYVAVAGAQRIGADVVPLLAGLGVGGLAVALAAQKTLANFIGSLILLTNKPVREGDFCRYGGDQIGTVERIGLHSTRIRTLERSVVTIPNADFSEMQIDNFSQRDERLFKTVIQLRYETTTDQLRYLLVRLRELLLGHPMVTPDPARARFVGFGAFSKDVELFAYFRCREQKDFLAIQEDLLLRIEDIVNEAGTGFAFPSQTAYLARDGGIDTERGAVAEEQTQLLRATNKLPFPDFEEETADNLEDILDYPPKGSPDAAN